MPKLPTKKRSTAQAIFDRIKRDNSDWRRPHLGASLIGGSCNRELWYIFRWACNPDFEGRMLRLFERGQREEEWIIEELRAAGFEVLCEEDGHQYRFKVHGGHFAGSIDGKVLGIPEAAKTWHLLEVKTSNDRRFQALKKEGVEKNQPKHYSQMQIYCHFMKLKRALYLCVCKNTDEIYTERINYDKAVAVAILNKAERIIGSPEPLSRLSEDPTWFECRFCDQRPHCQLGQTQTLERNCRTCLSSTPMDDGTWECDYFKHDLDQTIQRYGCESHLFIPAMLDPWKPISAESHTNEAGLTIRWVTYKKPDGTVVKDEGREFTEA